MKGKPALHLYQGYGIEIEYMVVDRETLAVRPLVDELLREFDGGRYVNDYVENDHVAWSNELVAHVIELKCNGPAPDLDQVGANFHKSIRRINDALHVHGAMLLSTGAHPFMDPTRETRLWPHDYHEIYQKYDEVFDCRRHGWANLQSMHINLPFHGDEEFGRLHAAIRLLLPLLPAIGASTPMLDGRLTGVVDTRLVQYAENQKRVPILAGDIIPEAVFTRQDYFLKIHEPIMAAMKPFDPEVILEHEFLNSRGAIARFDRSAIEIRLLDAQECISADLALAATVVAVLRRLTDARWAPIDAQKAFESQKLVPVLKAIIAAGENALVEDADYLALFGIGKQSLRAGELWGHLLEQVGSDLNHDQRQILNHVLKHGTLSTRLQRALGPDSSLEHIQDVYRQIADCLQENTPFAPA